MKQKILTILVSLLFFTNLIFAQPTNVVPNNGISGISTNLSTLSWDPFGDNSPNEIYDIGLYEGGKSPFPPINGTGTLVFLKQGIDGVNTEYVDISSVSLKYNTIYYWYIQNQSNGTFYEYSFTTVSHKLVSPINTITGVSILPTFEWEGDPDLDYDLIIAENSALTLNPKTVSSINGLTYTLDETTDGVLQNNKEYYWKVISNNSTTDESDVWKFKTFSNVNLTLYNPANGTTVFSNENIMFTWGTGSFNSQLNFYLEIIASTTIPADWSSPDYSFDAGNSLYYSATLFGGTKYYWRLVAKYNNEVVKISAVKNFTTSGGAVQPIPSFPTSGTTVYSLQPALYWYTMTSTTGVEFEVEYATDAAFTQNIGTASGITDLYYQITTDLLPDQTYYWHVRSVYNGIESAWSGTVTFKTKGEGSVYKPTVSYPTSGVTLYTLTPRFSWYINGLWDGVVKYDLYVYEEPFDNVVDATTTDLYYDWNTPLEAGKTYKWKVKAYNSITTEEKYSEEGTFKTAGGTSNSIVITFPKNNPLLYTTTPSLGWYVYGAYQGFDSYVLKIKEASDNTAWSSVPILETINDIYQTSYTFTTELDYGKSYKWAVATYNSGSIVSSWYEGSFTIIGNSNAVLHLSSPANNSTIVGYTPTFRWYLTGNASSVNHFRLTYSRAENFDPLVTEVEITSDSYFEITNDLVPGSTYRWKVEVSYDGTNYETQSATYVFHTPAGTSPVVPIVGSPVDGVVVNENNTILSWYIPVQSESQLSYTVEVSDNPDFTNPSSFNNLNELQFETTNLAPGEYYWRVKSSNGTEESIYSSSAKFNVDGIVEVDDNEIQPIVYSLEQNYPNPFNPTTTIKFSLPESHFVSIKIYNMLGQEVRTLVNEQRNEGNHSIIWNGKDNSGNQLASGTYIYRIKAGDFTSTKKMILLK